VVGFLPNLPKMQYKSQKIISRSSIFSHIITAIYSKNKENLKVLLLEKEAAF